MKNESYFPNHNTFTRTLYKEKRLDNYEKMKKPCFHLMNRFNSLKHVQDFDADNSNNKKRKKRKKKKYSVRNFFVICAT